MGSIMLLSSIVNKMRQEERRRIYGITEIRISKLSVYDYCEGICDNFDCNIFFL